MGEPDRDERIIALDRQVDEGTGDKGQHYAAVKRDEPLFRSLMLQRMDEQVKSMDRLSKAMVLGAQALQAAAEELTRASKSEEVAKE